MKRSLLMKAFFLIFPVMLLFFGAASAEQAQRKLTIMVYMCGSNLESAYGSASADIEEMMAAKTNPRETGLLVMVGGSNTNAGDFSASSARILEIAAGRKRSVFEGEGLNMGERKTLADFIRFGVENRPAERYALILWDHGGGPLEGVCWDETHNMDNLSLSELIGALGDAGLERKLSWIGFDACLMSSLEVAASLHPYAEYMIASQETEPSFGWNYSFLADAAGDADGAETGRSIVDAYFAGREDTGEILTLACTDLSVIPEVVRAMDPVFLPLSRRLDREAFLSLSGLRMSTVGFGKATPTVPATGYDLVDVRDLVSKVQKDESAQALLGLLERAIVYNRSNEKGACGLTLYHPYFNKAGYTEKWSDRYRGLDFSSGYKSYLDSFGGMLTGTILFRWLDLIPRPVQAGGDGSCRVEMALTEEQAENAVAAQLLILQDTLGNQLDKNCVLIASCRAEIGADHIVRADWDGTVLYAESEGGEVSGPISYMLTEDGKTDSIIGYYVNKNDYNLNGQTVIFELDGEDASEYPKILRVRVWDEATQNFSSRNTFSEEGFGHVLFYNYHRIIPGADESNTLPPFETWAHNDNSLVAYSLNLPDPWRLHSVPLRSGRQTYAMFRILDSQQNVFCSLPVEIPDADLSVLKAASGTVEAEGIRADMFCRLNTSAERSGLQLEWTLENHREEEVRFVLRELVINGVRISNESFLERVQPGAVSFSTVNIGRRDLVFLDTLKTISGTLEAEPKEGEKIRIPFCFTFDDADISVLGGDAVSLSETGRDGISLKLLSVEEDDSVGWNICILARNDRAEEYNFHEALLNGTSVGGGMPEKLPAGMERVYAVNAENIISSISLDIPGIDSSMFFVNLEENVLQEMGMRELNRIAVVPDKFTAEKAGLSPLAFELPLETPLALEKRAVAESESLIIPVFSPPQELGVPDGDRLPVLMENNVCRLRLRRLAAGQTKISLLMEWTNESDVWLTFNGTDGRVNGKEAYFYSTWSVPPHSVLLAEASYSDFENLDDGIRELEFSFYDDDRGDSSKPFSMKLTLPEPLRMGQPGGGWLNGESVEADTVRPADVDTEKERNPRALLETVLVPEHPESCRKIIEVPLDRETEEKIDFCRVALLRKDAEDFWQIVSLNDVKPDGSGILHIPHPGLFPTVAENPEICVVTVFRGVNTEKLRGTLGLGFNIFCRSFDMVEFNPVGWEMDYASGTAAVTSCEQDKTPCRYQWELSSATFYAEKIRIVPGADGTLPHIADCEFQVEGGFFDDSPMHPNYVRMNNEPMQLQLRPITAEDDLYVMVSVVGKDKSKWSLPIFPYPVN